jgi:hypothetical protein
LHDADVDHDVESAVLDQIKRFGGLTPDRVKNKPQLAPGLDLFLSAFYDLDTERSLADLQPIPWSKVVEYGKFHGLAREEVDDLLYFIRAADNAYLRRMAEKRKQG